MKTLYRLVYASRATFKPFNLGVENGLDGNVARILAESRQNNQKRHLVGALYYGGGCFFQCLEGDKQDIDALYAKLLKDSRHRDLKILKYQPVDSIVFTSWEMKYATIDQEIRAFLHKYHLAKFDPYRLDSAMIDELLETLEQAQDDVPMTELNRMAENLAISAPVNPGMIQYGKLLSLAAVGVMVLACLIWI
jgi:hypothetical protein